MQRRVSTGCGFCTIVSPMHRRHRTLAPLLALLTILGFTAGRAGVPNIYPQPDQATADLAAALHTAAATHRRVIVDFGGNWCPDCHVLDEYLHDAANQPILDTNYVLV